VISSARWTARAGSCGRTSLQSASAKIICVSATERSPTFASCSPRPPYARKAPTRLSTSAPRAPSNG